jgi:DNA-binding response OmpR family regulator
MRVLVVEDDGGLASVLERGLTRAGYVVDVVGTAERAIGHALAYEYDVAVIDWRLPQMSGVELIGVLRDRHINTPVVMLTARDTTADRIQGLDAGADDYVIKPFDFNELLARLRALQRRPAQSLAPRLEVGEISYDPAVHEATIHGETIDLTGIERGILELLLRRFPSVVTRREIAVHVWDDEADVVGSTTIDVHLARLRSKLGESSTQIETVRGVGYRLVAPKDVDSGSQ